MNMFKRLAVLGLCFFVWTVLADFTGKCVGVTDGDTVVVLNDGKEVKIRLQGIDCPETGQDFGKKAKQFASAMVFDKNVEVKEDGKDKYGRTLGTVIVAGKNLNLELVKAGLAWHYKQYSTDKELADAENKAKEAMLGLWGMNNPVPPWIFRHGGNNNQAQSSSQVQESQKKDTISETVYITKSGKKYHRAGCRYLKSSIAIRSKDDAVKRGYTPCSACNP